MHTPTRIPRTDQTRVRAPRVPFDLEVRSKTIGTSADYSFSTEDVSRSGLLLLWEKDGRMPFIVNTLIEMVIDPDASCLDQPVMCLGKVVRRENAEGGNGTTTRLGIQIVQWDHHDQNLWEGCLSQLEQRFGVDSVAKSA